MDVQPTQSAQLSQRQKLRWYADRLMADAAAAERNKDNDGAVAAYLKAADLLLLLGKAEEDYTAWKNYADKADYCQHRVKVLLPG